MAVEQRKELCAISIRESDSDGDEKDEKRMFINAIISSGKIDGHGTYMTEKTLKNFAKDLETDIQFKDSHRRGNGFGVSQSGEYDGDDNVVSGDFKLVRGMPLNDASYPNSDTFIDAIKEGIITRVSVGFSGGRSICSICESDWYQRSCYHWPGKSYEIVGKDGKSETVRCEVAVDDAHLVEVSAVSRGSNPDAQIVKKAQHCHEHGRLPPDIREEIEDVYGMRFADIISIPEEDKMSQELQDKLTSVESERDAANQKISELEPLATDGEEARKYMRGMVLDSYKVARSNATEDDIEKIKKRMEKYDFGELLEEFEGWREKAPEKPKIEPGSKTKQPDNSANPDGKREQKTVGVNPPHWGV